MGGGVGWWGNGIRKYLKLTIRLVTRIFPASFLLFTLCCSLLALRSWFPGSSPLNPCFLLFAVRSSLLAGCPLHPAVHSWYLRRLRRGQQAAGVYGILVDMTRGVARVSLTHTHTHTHTYTFKHTQTHANERTQICLLTPGRVLTKSASLSVSLCSVSVFVLNRIRCHEGGARVEQELDDGTAAAAALPPLPPLPPLLPLPLSLPPSLPLPRPLPTPASPL